MLIERYDDGSVMIKLWPSGLVKRYPSERSARMRRRKPKLDDYGRKERTDKTLIWIIDLIEQWFRNNVPMSPDKKDTVKLRDKNFPTQYIEHQALHRYKTMNELWAKFKVDYPDL